MVHHNYHNTVYDPCHTVTGKKHKKESMEEYLIILGSLGGCATF